MVSLGINRYQSDGCRLRLCGGSVVESGSGKPGHRPKLSHRPGQKSLCLPHDMYRYSGRKNPETPAEKGKNRYRHHPNR